MKLSQLFGRTLREAPAEAQSVSDQLALRAGLARPAAQGVYGYLPLGRRVIEKIATIIREEINTLGGQEVFLPLVDSAENDALTAVIADLTRREISSHKQLPVLIYQIQPQLHDEPRSLMAVLKSAYSLHADADLDDYYQQIQQVYFNIFQRCGLEPLTANISLTENDAHSFVVLSEMGETELLTCADCDYVARADSAIISKEPPKKFEMLPVEEVYTPEAKTIQAVANFVGVDKTRTLKVVLYAVEGSVVFVVVRGDLDVNEAKVRRILGVNELYAAVDHEIRAVGAVPGFASPVGLKNIKVIADESVTLARNLVAGANKEDYHLKNVNYGRDFTADMVVDVAQARAGDSCVYCDGKLEEHRGIELGNVAKLGTRYSEDVGATYLDAQGKAQTPLMGIYQINLERVLAAMIEKHHDDYGIIWPAEIAPYQIHLVLLGKKPNEIEIAERLYAELSARYEVLYDDRSDSAGVKFNDADLLGVPVRVTVSKRQLKNNCVEVKRRAESERHAIELDALMAELEQMV